MSLPINSIALIRQLSPVSLIEINIDNTGWTAIQNTVTPGFLSWPLDIINPNPSSQQYVQIKFITDITFTFSDQHFICKTSYIIFGEEQLQANGTRPVITIENVGNYPGLIQNGNVGNLGNGNSNVYICNLSVNSSGNTTLAPGGGWLGQSYFGKNVTTGNNYIINCTSNGDITQDSGGIVGQAVGQGTGGGIVNIIGCNSSGDISISGGGISGSSGIVIINNCFSTGQISDSAGGICGAGTFDSVISVCYSQPNNNSIATNGGGIFGANCIFSGADDCYCLATTVGTNAGAIFGANTSSSNVANSYGYIRMIGSSGFSSNTTLNVYTISGTWAESSANSALTGVPISPSNVGNTWIRLVVDQPYILNNFGGSPFTLNNIFNNNIVKTFFGTVTVGQSTTAAPVANFKTFDIKSGGHPTISISNTGVITTTSLTPLGVYNLIIYGVDDYTTTTYILTVNDAPSPAPILNALAQTVPPCCQPNVCNKNPQESNYNDSVITNKAAGKAVDKSVENFYVGVATGGRTAHSQPIFKSYYDYMNYLQGKYK